MNAYEVLGRQHKVDKLCAYLLERLVTAARGFDEEQWEACASEAGVKPPSEETQAAVLGQLRAMAKAKAAWADCVYVRDDLWAVLSASPSEVEGLRAALIAGKVDGSAYEGDCACLVGTLANVRQCSYMDIPGLRPDSLRPAERFFLAINPGDTPENSQACKLAVEWIDEWLLRVRAAFATTGGQA